MSQAEVDRLLADIQTNPQILEALPGLGDAAGIVAYANAHGYAITSTDVQAYLEAHPQGEATDAALTGASAARKHHNAVTSHGQVAVGITNAAAVGGTVAIGGAAASEVVAAAAVGSVAAINIAGIAAATATTAIGVA
ncbi:Nif11 family protein [Nitrospirillum sp. BR 11828]|uniref:Nif11 family protein n=1 Tax=Nitrospirillum sp. BR 11828 TaxID=3104325 RepID=UPI002ACAA68C|nr:Nif11 family protein [Nitrospirillum sp. BR 11828]MDZ5650733.1 Nif11 family protein [Nitrospirillum sp. BR 11828]